MNNALQKYRCLDSFSLKAIALISMTFDHVAEFLAPVLPIPEWFHIVGRVAAPVFMFLLAWSFFYTRSRPRLMLRLYLWNMGMQGVSAALVLLAKPYGGGEIVNGIFGTMFYIIYTLYFVERLRWGVREKNAGKICIGAVGLLLPFLITAALLSGPAQALLSQGLSSASPIAQWLVMWLTSGVLLCPMFVEGGLMWVLFGVALYYLRERPIGLTVLFVLFAALFVGTVQPWMALAIPLILLYNGERGRPMKNFFYIYYPAHVYLLYTAGVALYAVGLA